MERAAINTSSATAPPNQAGYTLFQANYYLP